MKHLLILLLFIAVGNASGQNAYTLQQALDYAVQNSPLVKNAKVDIEIYKQKVKEVTAIGLPQLNAEGSFNHFLNIPTTVIPATAFNPFANPNETVAVQFGTKYQTSAGATLSQLIFDGSYIVGLKATKSLMDLQTQLEQKTEIDVKNEVTKAYYMAAIADENIKTLSLTLENLEKLKNETAAINKEGLVESQNVEQLELTVADMRTTISRAQNMKKMAYNMLKLNMGIDIANEITLTDNIDQLNATFNPADYQNKEFSTNNVPEYKLLQTQVKLNELNMQNEKMKYYPSFGAFITHSYNLPSNDLDIFTGRRWYPTSIWGLKLTVPVFSSGMRRARVQQAKLTIDKSVTTLDNTGNALKMQAENAKLNMNFAIENLNNTKKSLELADKIQQKTLTKYKEGVASSLELNQVQMQYLTAQSNYVNALYSVLNSKAEMDKAFGLLTPTK